MRAAGPRGACGGTRERGECAELEDGHRDGETTPKAERGLRLDAQQRVRLATEPERPREKEHSAVNYPQTTTGSNSLSLPSAPDLSRTHLWPGDSNVACAASHGRRVSLCLTRSCCNREVPRKSLVTAYVQYTFTAR